MNKILVSILGILLSFITIPQISIMAQDSTMPQIDKNETITFVDPFGKFRLDYPSSDWKAEGKENRFDTSKENLVLTKTNHLEGTLIIHIMPFLDVYKSMKENHYTWNQIIEPTFDGTFNTYVSERFSGVNLVETPTYDKYKISGVQAGSVIHNVNYEDESMTGLFIHSLIGSDGVMVWYLADPKYFDKTLPEAENIIESLLVLGCEDAKFYEGLIKEQKMEIKQLINDGKDEDEIMEELSESKEYKDMKMWLSDERVEELMIDTVDKTRLDMALEKIPVDTQGFGCTDKQKVGFKLAQILKQGEEEWTKYWQTNNYGLDRNL